MPKFMKSLNNISRSQSVYRAARLNVDGICPHHHTFILAISRMAGCSQDELAKEICLNKSTVARTLTQLEEKGYVRREENSGDKRSMLVYPTEKMLEILPQVRLLAKEWNNLISKDIPKDELEIFFSVLSRIEEKAKEITTNQEKK
ncbi:MAG: MarR family transcriptional regulator [Clostridia bacterium]|nr:MarR family transcriptional regulator [Clostridia bacterium]